MLKFVLSFLEHWGEYPAIKWFSDNRIKPDACRKCKKPGGACASSGSSRLRYVWSMAKKDAGSNRMDSN